MKIQIDFMDSLPLKGQMTAVEKYITKNIGLQPCPKLVVPEVLEKKINTTPKGTASKVETELGNYHVMCRKTKGGMYKFETWRAI